ncbi:MAG TPA: hypothetical protein VIM56_16585 [Rhizomicrobium sp.]
MKLFLIGTVCAAISTIAAWADGRSPWVSQQNGKICLRSDHIQHKIVLDNRTILFRMDGGTAWKNTLQKTCPGLTLASGFAMAARTNYICANQQPIRAIGAGNTCYLGDFIQVPAKP